MIKVELTIATIYTKLDNGLTVVRKYCILGKKTKKEAREMFLKIFYGNGIVKCSVIELEKKTDILTLSIDDLKNKSVSDIISNHCNKTYDTTGMLL